MDFSKALGLNKLLISLTLMLTVLSDVEGYSAKDPVSTDIDLTDGLGFDLDNCRSMEECAAYFNKSDPLRDAVLFNEEETLSQPCLIHGELKASSNWYGYLANGTLAANLARFYYRIVYPEEKCCIKLLLYLNEQVSALRAHMNCLQRQSIIATNPKQIITLSPSVESSGCTSNHTRNGVRMIECNSGRILRSSYDQHWHFAASSCGSPSGLSMQFTIVFYGLRGECPYYESSSTGNATTGPSILLICTTILLCNANSFLKFILGTT